MVVWLIGKSGAGKTSIGEALFARIKADQPNSVFLDGDCLREAVGEDLGYTIDDRLRSERRTSRLCKLLADQGIHVVCAKLSNAPDIRRWNRANIRGYREIYIQADDAILEADDEKGLYGAFDRGEIANVVGKDIPFHKPTSPWMTVQNDRAECVESIADEIFEQLRRGSQAPIVRETVSA